MANKKFFAVRELVLRWQKRTHEILKEQIKIRGIGVTDELYQDLKHSLEQKTAGLLHAELVMLKRGRMIDMGVGRGVPLERVKLQREKSRGAKTKRYPKKWYSKVFYGRLNDLQGAIGFKVMEEAQSVIAEAFR
jgi:hypothetical protein